MMSGLYWGTIIFAILTIVGVIALGFFHPAPPERSARDPKSVLHAPIPTDYKDSPIEQLASKATDEL